MVASCGSRPAATSTLGAASSTPAPQALCTDYVGPRVLGRVTDPRLSEISGLAASRAHPGVLYVQNDSGEPHARFFAIDTTGAVLAEHFHKGSENPNELPDRLIEI